jgi:hypothetical protein
MTPALREALNVQTIQYCHTYVNGMHPTGLKATQKTYRLQSIYCPSTIASTLAYAKIPSPYKNSPTKKRLFKDVPIGNGSNTPLH